MYSNQIWFNTTTFPRNIVKTLEIRQYSCEFCLVTEKNCQVLNFAEPKMSEVSDILDFLWRSYTGVYQDKKIQKVREIGHLRHIWFEYTHSTVS